MLFHGRQAATSEAYRSAAGLTSMRGKFKGCKPIPAGQYSPTLLPLKKSRVALEQRKAAVTWVSGAQAGSD